MNQTTVTAGVQNKHGVQVGDIFSATWGYDETHVNFYKVIRVTAAKAEVVPINATVVMHGGAAGNRVVANVGSVRDWDVLIGINREDVKKSKLCTTKFGWKDQPAIVLRGGQHWATKWDGKAAYQTDTMFGR